MKSLIPTLIAVCSLSALADDAPPFIADMTRIDGILQKADIELLFKETMTSYHAYQKVADLSAAELSAMADKGSTRGDSIQYTHVLNVGPDWGCVRLHLDGEHRVIVNHNATVHQGTQNHIWELPTLISVHEGVGMKPSGRNDFITEGPGMPVPSIRTPWGWLYHLAESLTRKPVEGSLTPTSVAKTTQGPDGSLILNVEIENSHYEAHFQTHDNASVLTSLTVDNQKGTRHEDCKITYQTLRLSDGQTIPYPKTILSEIKVKVGGEFKTSTAFAYVVSRIAPSTDEAIGKMLDFNTRPMLTEEEIAELDRMK